MRALCLEISTAHDTHCTLCCLPSEASGEGGSVQVRTSPYKSVFPCPHPVPCAMCFASQREYALLFFERYAHGARGETSLFPVSPSPFSPVCCKEACGTQCGFFKLEALASSPPRAVRRRLSARWRHGAAAMWSAVGLAPSRASRPLRARHRRASPRVLELHRDVLPPAPHLSVFSCKFFKKT